MTAIVTFAFAVIIFLISALTNQVDAANVVRVSSFFTSETCSGSTGRILWKGISKPMHDYCRFVHQVYLRRFTDVSYHRLHGYPINRRVIWWTWEGLAWIFNPFGMPIFSRQYNWKNPSWNLLWRGRSCRYLSCELLLITGVCQPDGTKSIRYAVVDDGMEATVFTEKADCTGPSSKVTFEIGTCQVVSDLPGMYEWRALPRRFKSHIQSTQPEVSRACACKDAHICLIDSTDDRSWWSQISQRHSPEFRFISQDILLYLHTHFMLAAHADGGGVFLNCQFRLCKWIQKQNNKK